MKKTLTFAILHFSVAFGVAYTLTGSMGIASGVALIEPLVNTVAFYCHEKAWQRVEQRKQTNPSSDDDCATDLNIQAA